MRCFAVRVENREPGLSLDEAAGLDEGEEVGNLGLDSVGVVDAEAGAIAADGASHQGDGLPIGREKGTNLFVVCSAGRFRLMVCPDPVINLSCFF